MIRGDRASCPRSRPPRNPLLLGHEVSGKGSSTNLCHSLTNEYSLTRGRKLAYLASNTVLVKSKKLQRCLACHKKEATFTFKMMHIMWQCYKKWCRKMNSKWRFDNNVFLKICWLSKLLPLSKWYIFKFGHVYNMDNTRACYSVCKYFDTGLFKPYLGSYVALIKML